MQSNFDVFQTDCSLASIKYFLFFSFCGPRHRILCKNSYKNIEIKNALSVKKVCKFELFLSSPKNIYNFGGGGVYPIF